MLREWGALPSAVGLVVFWSARAFGQAAPAAPPPKPPPAAEVPAKSVPGAPPGAAEPPPAPATEASVPAAPPVEPAASTASAIAPADVAACPCEPREPAWHFMFPVELGQGAAWSEDRASPGYIFTPRLLPGVSTGLFHFNLVASAPYKNPDWDFGAGGRAGFVIARLLEGISGFDFDVEGLYLVRAQNARVSGGIRMNIGRLIQFGPRFGYDVDRKDYFAETTISLDFAALDDPVGALIGVGPMRDYRDDEP